MVQTIPFLMKAAGPGILHGQMNCPDDLDKFKGIIKIVK